MVERCKNPPVPLKGRLKPENIVDFNLFFSIGINLSVTYIKVLDIVVGCIQMFDATTTI